MKSGFHAVFEDNYYSAIDNAVKYSFQFVQYDIAVPGFDPQRLSNNELIKLRDYALSRDIELCFHAPGDYMSFYFDQVHVVEGILKYYKSLLEKLEELKARHLTIHLGEYPKFKKAKMPGGDFIQRYSAYFDEVLYENIMKLLSYSENTLICVENFKFDVFIMKTLERVLDNNKQICLTMDIAKACNPDGTLNKNVYGFMLKHIERIKEVHIHDWIRNFGSHQVVGDGFIDFTLFKGFYSKEDVYINYEVRPLEQAVRSRDIFEQKYLL